MKKIIIIVPTGERTLANTVNSCVAFCFFFVSLPVKHKRNEHEQQQQQQKKWEATDAREKQQPANEWTMLIYLQPQPYWNIKKVKEKKNVKFDTITSPDHIRGRGAWWVCWVCVMITVALRLHTWSAVGGVARDKNERIVRELWKAWKKNNIFTAKRRENMKTRKKNEREHAAGDVPCNPWRKSVRRFFFINIYCLHSR